MVVHNHRLLFYFSVYDLLRTQNWCFSKVAAPLLFCTTVCRQVHWTRLTNLAGEVLFERKSPAAMQEGTLCEQIDQRKPGRSDIPRAEDEKAENIPHFQFDETSLDMSKRINASCRLDQELCAAENRKRRVPSCVI